MRSTEITVRTGRVPGVFDVTGECERFVAEVAAKGELGNGRDGLLNVFVPHATAGIVIVEVGAGSDDDLLAALDRILPADDGWRHRHGSPGHGRDHVVPLLAPPSITIPVVDGRLALGTWQSVCLLDTNVDNTERTVRLSFLA